MKQRPRSIRGFTLVELLVGMSLAMLIMAAVLSSYTYMGRGLFRLVNQQSLQRQAQNTIAYFTQDVRMASGLTDTGNLSATRVSLLIPAGTTTNTITYYYNNTPSSATVAVNGTNITMAANTLTRCIYNGSTVTSRALLKLRNINDSAVATRADLTIHYYDTSGNEYSSYVNHLSGIKQLAIEFTATTGNFSSTDTVSPQTATYQSISPRLVIRNRSFLP